MNMPCPKCSTLLPSRAVSCSVCSAIITGIDRGRTPNESSGSSSELDSELERLDQQLRDSMAKMNQELEQVLGSSSTGGAMLVNPSSESSKPLSPNGKAINPELGNGKSIGLLSDAEKFGFLCPLGTRIESSYSAVVHSPHVLGNYEYRIKAKSIDFYFQHDEDLVNAYAMSPGPGNSDLKNPAIVYFAGLANIIRVTAAVVANHHRQIQKKRYSDPVRFKENIRSISQRMADNQGYFSLKDTDGLVQNVLFPKGISDETIVAYAQNYTEAMERFVFAHELGHICYGHTMGRRDNYDISRMQERDADSFASQCFSSDSHRETLFLGQLFVNLIFAWNEERGNRSELTTHPAGRERFMNAIHLNPAPAKEALETLGLAVDDLIALLP